MEAAQVFVKFDCHGVTMSGPANATRSFLGEEPQWPVARVVLDDVQGLWGGRRIAVDGSGRLVVQVVEPGQRSMQTARQIESLARGLGVKEVFVVGNKIRQDSEKDFILRHLEGMKFLGFMSYAGDAVTADLDGKSPYDASPGVREEAKKIKAALDQLMKK